MGIDSNLLIILGVAGLVCCGVWKYAPRLATWLPSRQPARSNLAEITLAYATLQTALIANGSVSAADQLRTAILPEAGKIVPREPAV